jgi:transposase
MHAIIHPADIQDRDCGLLVLKTLFGRYPFMKALFADGGYQGPVFADGQKKSQPNIETKIVKRSERAKGRWVVERTFAWLGRCRRLAKDFENISSNALAFLRLASIRLMLRKLCK